MQQEFLDLSEDSIFDYIQKLEYPDIIQFCQTNRRFRQICQLKRFSQIIQMKKQFVIPITIVPTNRIILFDPMRGRLIESIKQPIRGNLVEIDSKLFIIKESFINETNTQLAGYITEALAMPVYEIIGGYAIIDPLDTLIQLKLALSFLNKLEWKTQNGDLIKWY